MRPRGAPRRDAGAAVASLLAFAETDRLQVLALRRQHVGRVQRSLVAFLHLGMQEVGQNRQNEQPTARRRKLGRVNGNEPRGVKYGVGTSR